MKLTFQERGLKDVVARLHRVEVAFNSLGALKASLGRMLKRQTQDRIQFEKHDPAGQPWAAWSPSYAATRGPGDSLLMSSRRLLNGIKASVTQKGVAITSDQDYALAVNAARPFIGISDANNHEIEDFVNGWLAKL